MDRTTQSSLYLTEACWEGRSKAHKLLSFCGLSSTQPEMLLMFLALRFALWCYRLDATACCQVSLSE